MRILNGDLDKSSASFLDICVDLQAIGGNKWTTHFSWGADQGNKHKRKSINPTSSSCEWSRIQATQVQACVILGFCVYEHDADKYQGHQQIKLFISPSILWLQTIRREDFSTNNLNICSTCGDKPEISEPKTNQSPGWYDRPACWSAGQIVITGKSNAAFWFNMTMMKSSGNW